MNPFTNIRPFQLIVLIVFGLAAILGLILLASYTGMGGGPKVGTVVIWGTLPANAVDDEISALQNQNKSYSKVTYVQKPAAGFDNAVADAIASGNGPDLVIISQEQLLTESNKISVIPFSEISQRTFINTFLPEYQLYLSPNGMLGIPYVLDPLVLYDNQSLLSSAGVAQAPTTWEAVTGLAPSLTRAQGQSISRSAIALGEYSNIQNARAILSLLFFQAGSSITQSSDAGMQSTLASPASGQSANGMVPGVSALNFYTQFSNPSRQVYSWNGSFSSDQQAFLAGNLALYVGYASEEPFLKSANPNLAFDMAQVPQLQSSSVAKDYGLAYAFVIPKAAPNPKGALATAIALTDKGILPAAAQELSMAPAQRTLLTPSASDVYAPVFYPEALVAQGWLSPSPAATDNVFSAMINSITSGQYNTTEAIDAANQTLDAAFSQ